MEIISSNSEVESKGTLETAANFITSTLRTLIFTPSTPAVGHASESDSKLNEISLSEVAEHDLIEDCWIVLYDRVYDITNFFDNVSFFCRVDNEIFFEFLMT